MLPALIGATKIGQMILRPSADEMLQQATGTMYLNDEFKAIGLEIKEIEVQAGSPLCEQSLSEVDVGTGVVIVAVRRPDGQCIRDMQASVKLGPGDIFIVLGQQGAVPQLARKARTRTAVSYRGAAQ